MITAADMYAAVATAATRWGSKKDDIKQKC